MMSDLAMKLATGFSDVPDLGQIIGGYAPERKFGDRAKGLTIMPPKKKTQTTRKPKPSLRQPFGNGFMKQQIQKSNLGPGYYAVE